MSCKFIWIWKKYKRRLLYEKEYVLFEAVAESVPHGLNIEFENIKYEYWKQLFLCYLQNEYIIQKRREK